MPSGVRNQYIAAVAACLSALNSAACYSWLTPLLPRLLQPDSPVPLQSGQLPWVVSVVELGCLVSPLAAGVLSGRVGCKLLLRPCSFSAVLDYLPLQVSVVELGCLVSPLAAGLLSGRVGRKLLLLSSAPLFLLSWTILLGYRTVLSLAAARFLQGFTIGLVNTTLPVYLHEISSPSSRGIISRMHTSVWWLAFLLEFAVGPHLCFFDLTYFTMMLNIPFCLFFIWQPESPAFYLMIGDEESATRCLFRLRDGNIDAIKREIDEMRLHFEISKKSATFRELLSTSVDKKGLSILLMITSVRVLSGNCVLVVFATHIFQKIHDLPFSADHMTVALGVVMFFGSIGSTFLAESTDRKPLLIFASVGSFFCHLLTGTFFLLQEHTSVDLSTSGWLPPLAILVYSGLYAAAVEPVSVAYTSELFRSSTRGIASSISSLHMTVLIFVMLSIYEPTLHDYGMSTNFFLYALACLVGSVFFYSSAPETKGKSFFQIRKALTQTTAPERIAEREPLFVDIDVDDELL